MTTFFDRHIVREATTVELVRLSLSRLNAFKAEVTTPHRAAAPASTMIVDTEGNVTRRSKHLVESRVDDGADAD